MKRDAPVENAQIGDDTIVEPGVRVGFRYHPACGKALVGGKGILRSGTIIYGDVKIGDYFQSGHNAVIRARVEIGDYCTVSNHSTLEGLARLGDGVRIMSHVYVPSRTVIGNRVFIGPGVVFLNDRCPGRHQKPAVPVGAIIEDNVVIGGGAVILPGVTVGERSFIAAGAVVVADVPPRSLVKGVPGRVEKLPASLDRDNSAGLIEQPLDIWHPLGPDPREADWPAKLGRAPLEPEEPGR